MGTVPAPADASRFDHATYWFANGRRFARGFAGTEEVVFWIAKFHPLK